MSESAASGDAGQSDPDPASSASSGSGVPEGYVPRTELEAVEARRRSLQGERDRFAARISELEAAASGGNGNGGGTQAAPSGVTLDQVASLLDRRDQMTAAKARVSQDFPLARPEVLNAQHATVEEYIAAASRSHEQEKAYQDSLRADIEAKVKADLAAKHPQLAGTLAPSTPPAGGEGGTAEITPQRFAAMSHAEKMAVPDDVLAALASQGA